jgi:hypothetical protein
VLENSIESIALVCEALASPEARADPEVKESILWVLSPAWKSGAIDLAPLLRAVQGQGTEQARAGAALAIDWLGIDA